jgi:tetratricopeptide (TPR) repeat protein
MDDRRLEQLKHLVARTTAQLEDWTAPIKGTAFLITRIHALTCAHCLKPRGSDTWARHITLHFSRWGTTGEPRDAYVVGEPDWERDIAVLQLAEALTLEMHLFPLARNAAHHARWETFAHPSPGADAGLVLDGTVLDPGANLPHRRSRLLVMQLTCHQAQDRINGASGAPVVVDNLIVGMLNNQLAVKQEPDVYSPDALPRYIPVYATAYALPIEAMQDVLCSACPEVLVRPPIAGPPRVEPSLTLGPREHSGRRNRLHYGYEAVEFVGRSQEWSELLTFLAPQPQRPVDLAWWLWTAPGGQGKSRLAFRLCMEMQRSGWWCGFLSSTTEFEHWQEWVVDQPTLIVIDHIAHRAKEVQQAICTLSRHDEHIRAPLRLLLLERRFQPEDGWVEQLVPQAHPEDMADFFAYAYDPMGEYRADALQHYERQLGPLGSDYLWQIVQMVLGEYGMALPDRDTTLTLLRQIDPLARPLFAILAADAMGAAGLDQIRRWNRADLVSFILQQEVSLWKERLQLTTPGIATERRRNFEEHLNLVISATIAGWQTTYACERLRKHAVPVPDRILPDWLREMTGYAWEEAEATVPSFTPDILGELFILERLLGNFGVDANKQVPREQTQRVLDVALAESMRATVAFIRRCVEDFPEHPALERFTAMQIPEGRDASDGLYQDYSVAMQQVAHILEAAEKEEWAAQCYTQLLEVGQSLSQAPDFPEESVDRYRRLATFFYNRAVITSRYNDTDSAEQDYNQAIARIDRLCHERKSGAFDFDDYRVMQVRANALRLRAILRSERNDVPGAFTDLERILIDQEVNKFSRAEALLYRAKLYSDQADYGAALSDYEEILAMSGADLADRGTFSLLDRVELYSGQADALADRGTFSLLDFYSAEFSALSGADLAELQHLAAERASPLLGLEAHRAFQAGDYTTALRLLERVLNLSGDHPDRQAMAHVDRSVIHLQRENGPAAIEDCNAVLQAQNSPLDQQLKARINRAQAYLQLREFDQASTDVEHVLGAVSAAVREWGIAMLTRAQIRHAQGDIVNAHRDLLAVIDQRALDADLRQHAGRLFAQCCSTKSI